MGSIKYHIINLISGGVQTPEKRSKKLGGDPFEGLYYNINDFVGDWPGDLPMRPVVGNPTTPRRDQRVRKDEKGGFEDFGVFGASEAKRKASTNASAICWCICFLIQDVTFESGGVSILGGMIFCGRLAVAIIESKCPSLFSKL